MKKIIIAFAFVLSVFTSLAQAVKPDAILSPNGPNTSVYWNVKFKTLILPKWTPGSPPLYQGRDTVGGIFVSTDVTDKHIYVKMIDGNYTKIANFSDISGGGGGGTWGSITGILSAQTDLQSALNAKQNLLGYTAQNISNIATSFAILNNTLYPSTQAVANYAYPLTGNPSNFLTGIIGSDVITALGYTPVTDARTITINGTTYDLTANRSWTITSGVPSVFGRTGAVVAASNDYTFAQIGSTPTTIAGYGITDAALKAITLTINGVTYDLSANRSWTVGSTITPVSGEIPSGTINGTNPTFTIAHTPVAGSLSVYINGLMERPTTDWSISGTTITMVDIPQTGDNLMVNYQY